MKHRFTRTLKLPKNSKTLTSTVLLSLAIPLGTSACKKRTFNNPESGTKYAASVHTNYSISADLFKNNSSSLRVCVVDDSEQKNTEGRIALVTNVVRDAWEPWLYLIERLPGFKDKKINIDIQVKDSCRDRLHDFFLRKSSDTVTEGTAFVEADAQKRKSEGPPTHKDDVVIFIRGNTPLSNALFGNDTRSFAQAYYRVIAMLSPSEMRALQNQGDEIPHFTRILTHEIGHLFGLGDLYAFDGAGVLPGQNQSIMASTRWNVSSDEYHGLRAIQEAVRTGKPIACLPPYVRMNVTPADGVHAGSASDVFCTLDEKGNEANSWGGYYVYKDIAWTRGLPEAPPTSINAGTGSTSYRTPPPSSSGHSVTGQPPAPQGSVASSNKDPYSFGTSSSPFGTGGSPYGTNSSWASGGGLRRDAAELLAAAVGKSFQCAFGKDKTMKISIASSGQGGALTLNVEAPAARGNTLRARVPVTTLNPELRFSDDMTATLDGQLVATEYEGQPALGLHVWKTYELGLFGLGGLTAKKVNTIYICSHPL